MGSDDDQEDEGPLFAWLPPEDRLWRHPSEIDPDAITPVTGGSQPAGHVWTVAMAAGLVGALVASALFVATGTLRSHTTRVLEPIATPSSVLTNDNHTSPSATSSSGWAGVASSLAASMVGVSSSVGDTVTASGSGIVYAAGGGVTDIITARDLLFNGGTLEVKFDNGASQPAQVIGSDPTTGIAIVAVSGPAPGAPASYGSVSTVAVAEPVLAVGARADAPDVGTGTISGLDQSVVDANSDSTLFGMLAITGGPVSDTNNGGAVVDGQGHIVGIDSNVSDPQQQDVAYAVPMDVAMHVANQLLAHVTPTHPWIGVENATDLSTASAAELGVSGGAQIGAVAPSSPAASAGLRPNDIVTSLGGHSIRSSGALIQVLVADTHPEQRVRVDFLREGSAHRATVLVQNQPTSGP